MTATTFGIIDAGIRNSENNKLSAVRLGQAAGKAAAPVRLNPAGPQSGRPRPAPPSAFCQVDFVWRHHFPRQPRRPIRTVCRGGTEKGQRREGRDCAGDRMPSTESKNTGWNQNQSPTATDSNRPSITEPPQTRGIPRILPTPQRPAADTPATQPPESTDRTRNHKPKPEPVHTQTCLHRGHQPPHHRKTAEYQVFCLLSYNLQPPNQLPSPPGLRTEPENTSRKPVQSTQAPTVTRPPTTTPPQNSGIPRVTDTTGISRSNRDRQRHPKRGPNRRTRTENQSSPHGHRPSHAQRPHPCHKPQDSNGP